MIILTKNNAKERCRVCLCKLFKKEINLRDAENVTSFSSKFADINSNKELKEMLEKCVGTIEFGEDFFNDNNYPHYVCVECFKHLQTFKIFRNKAVDSAKLLYRVFSGNVSKVEMHDNGLEYKVNVEQQLTDCVKDDMFNLLLKDSLMETEAILLNSTDNNNDFNSTEPDPFQNTQNQGSKRKPRIRRAKAKKDLVSIAKKNNRKYKKFNILKDEYRKNKLETSLETKNRILHTEDERVDENLDWQDSAFQDPDDDSSDNEVLSKKFSHSDGTCKETNRDDDLLSNNKFRLKSLIKVEQATVEVNPSTSSTSKNNDFEHQPLESVKTELDCYSELSTESEFIKVENLQPNTTKTEKKKRHYILNSGRKKGLANKYKCDKCQHKFGHKLTLEAHVRKVHEGQKKAFKCQLCDKAYSFIGGLSTHIRDVHERKQDSYDCNVPGCDKKYSNFITLQRHVRFKHLNMETPHQYVCEQCGATFKQSSNLRYHMKTRHPTEEDLKRKELLPKDRLECEECKKSFHSQYTLKYHKLRVHADEKKFECKICGRRVAKQFMLDSHMLVHSDQKMACKFCGREFVRKYQVEAHIRAVHQKLKPFQCPHCSESFASRKTLRHHIYIHTGEKPYVCDICGQAYRQPTCLKNHRKIHKKLNANDGTSDQTANRNYISNFVQNNNGAVKNGDEN